MPEALHPELERLRNAFFAGHPESSLLHLDPTSGFQTPVLPEDGIAFFERWSEKPIALPFSLFLKSGEANGPAFEKDFLYAIRILEESTGEQNAFLSIGLLRAQDTAPLLLYPVKIDTKNWQVSPLGKSPIENVPLRLKTCGIVELPTAAQFESAEKFDIQKYFAAVEKAVKPVGWQSTAKGLFIGFYDSATLFANRDCESEVWNLKRSLGGPLDGLSRDEGFQVTDSDLDEKNPDEIFDPAEHYFVHTLDSQANTVLLETLSDKNALSAIEAPPGSARDPFIANLVAEEVSTGKKVLLAYRKLSSKIRFEQAFDSQNFAYRDTNLDAAREAVRKTRKPLVDYNRAVHLPLPSGGSFIDSMLAIASEDVKKKSWSDSTFQGAEFLDREQFLEMSMVLQDLISLADQEGAFTALKTFEDSELSQLSALQHQVLGQKLETALPEFQTLATLTAGTNGNLTDIGHAFTPDFNKDTPSFDGWTLDTKDWATYAETIRAIPAAGKIWSEFRRNGSPTFTAEAIGMQIAEAREIVRKNLGRRFKAFSEYYHSARKTLLKTLKNPKLARTDEALLQLTEELVSLQQNRKVYVNSSVIAGRLFGNDWQFEHTDWNSLAKKIKWLYKFREKVKGSETASLSYSILTRYDQIKSLVPDVLALDSLSRKAQIHYEEICRDLQVPQPTDESIAAQFQRIQKWQSHFAFLPLYVKLHAKQNALQNAGLKNLLAAALEKNPAQKFLVSDFSRFWHAQQIQKSSQIFPAIFSTTPQKHSKMAKAFRDASADLCCMNLNFAKDVLQRTPDRLQILPVGEVATLSQKTGLFDIAIILDAESVSPLQAFPALLRSNRAILFGDTHLPTPAFPGTPKNLRRKNFALPHFESILSFALSKGSHFSFLQLNVLHRNPALIDFANRTFYQKKIQSLPPSKKTVSEHFRVFHADDLSEKIAEAALKHVQLHPLQSFGIIVFSKERRQSVFQALQNKARTSPELANFLSPKDALRDTYVKLPEEAVGDYRDVLFICTESAATLADIGISEKDLTLCATHALSNLVLFVSNAKDRASNQPGIKTYQDWISDIEHGYPAPFSTDAAISKIENAIFQKISTGEAQFELNWNYNGASVLFAAKDAHNDEHFLLGVETDSCCGFLRQSVEDRLILRPKILEDLGWKIVRLWTPNWFLSTEDDVRHVLTTIAVEQSVSPVHSAADHETDLSGLEQEPYPLAPEAPKEFLAKPLPELSVAELIPQIRFYIDAESPIHERLLLKRMLRLHGIRSAEYSTIRLFKDAIVQGLAQKVFIKTGQFLYSTTYRPIVLRNRSTLPDGERDFAFVSPDERSLFPPGTDDWQMKEFLGCTSGSGF